MSQRQKMKGNYWPGQIARHQMHPAQAVRWGTSWPQNARRRPATRWTSLLCNSWQALETDEVELWKFLRWGWKHRTSMFIMWNENQVTSFLCIIIISIITIVLQYTIKQYIIHYLLPMLRNDHTKEHLYIYNSTYQYIYYIYLLHLLCSCSENLNSTQKDNLSSVIIHKSLFSRHRLSIVGLQTQHTIKQTTVSHNR